MFYRFGRVLQMNLPQSPLIFVHHLRVVRKMRDTHCLAAFNGKYDLTNTQIPRTWPILMGLFWFWNTPWYFWVILFQRHKWWQLPGDFPPLRCFAGRGFRGGGLGWQTTVATGAAVAASLGAMAAAKRCALTPWRRDPVEIEGLEFCWMPILMKITYITHFWEKKFEFQEELDFSKSETVAFDASGDRGICSHQLLQSRVDVGGWAELFDTEGIIRVN